MSSAERPLSHREWCFAFIHGFMSVDAFEPHSATPRVGDLILLTSAPPSLWSIAYLVDYKPIIHDGREIDKQWTLRALGTGELCNWSNVGMRVFRRKSLSSDTEEFSGVFHDPRLKMDSDQYKFWLAWSAEGRKADLYILLQTMPIFEGKRATCGWRIRFGWHETEVPPAVFADITKTTRAQMRAAIAEALKAHEAEQDRRKAERDAAMLAVGDIAAIVANLPPQHKAD